MLEEKKMLIISAIAKRCDNIIMFNSDNGFQRKTRQNNNNKTLLKRTEQVAPENIGWAKCQSGLCPIKFNYKN